MADQNEVTVAPLDNRTFQILPGEFWHVAPPNSFMLFTNAYLGEGICATVTAINASMPATPYAVSQFGLAARDRAREQVWERVRTEINPCLPSRINSFYLVDDQRQARKICDEWFRGQGRLMLRARIARDKSAAVRTNVVRADANWLDSPEEKWVDNATKYWIGEMTSDPWPEVIVDGFVYFPDWQQAPFGIANPRPAARPNNA